MVGIRIGGKHAILAAFTGQLDLSVCFSYVDDSQFVDGRFCVFPGREAPPQIAVFHFEIAVIAIVKSFKILINYQMKFMNLSYHYEEQTYQRISAFDLHPF